MMVDSEAWDLVMEGELGADAFWKGEFTAIEKCWSAMTALEELELNSISWDKLIKDLPRFEPIKHMTFPPLYDVNDLYFL